MLSHFNIGVSDFQRGFEFYDALFKILQLDLNFSEPEGFCAGWTKAGHDRPMVVVSQPFDEQPHAPGNGQMIAFDAANRSIVRQCHAMALEAGGTSEGEPGLRPHYHEHYFGAYFRDLDGNKLCICCHNEE